MPSTAKRPRKPWRKPGTDVTWSLRKVDALRRRCEDRGIEFSLSAAHLRRLLDDQHRCCAITGRKLVYSTDPSLDSGSIIRKDVTQGYVDGNVLWVTQQVNEAMGSGTLEDLYAFAHDVWRKMPTKEIMA